MSENNRLSTVAPDLVKLGESLSAEQRKVLACRIAEWACCAVGVSIFLDENHMRILLSTAYVATQEDRLKIIGYINDLDEKYFTIVEQYDGLDGAGNAMQWFSKARAVSSLLYALDSSAIQDFCETLYEAQAATGDLNELKRFVDDLVL